jgi:hypothetical protein
LPLRTVKRKHISGLLPMREAPEAGARGKTPFGIVGRRTFAPSIATQTVLEHHVVRMTASTHTSKGV